MNILALIAIGVLISVNIRHPTRMPMDRSMHDQYPMVDMGGDDDGRPHTAHEGHTMK